MEIRMPLRDTGDRRVPHADPDTNVREVKNAQN